MKTLLITDSDFSATDKNFHYLLGFQPSFGAMIVDNDKIKVFLDSRYFENTKSIDEGALRRKLGKPDLVIEYTQIKVYFLELIIEEIKNEEEVNFSNNIALKYYKYIKKNLTNTKINVVSDIFTKKRIVKRDSEIEKIKRAISIIDSTYEYIYKLNKKGKLVGKTELELRSLIIRKIFEFGGSGESFSAIVAFGKNSAIAHHSAGETIIGEGVLLIDMGAIYEGYCSDFTRTFWVHSPNSYDVESKKEYQEFIKIKSIVKQAHLEAFTKTRSGMTGEEIDTLARDYIIKKGYEDYFTHSTGHGIGVDVHEKPALSPRKDNILEDRMVFTIEPGIYLPGKFGVRLEDIVFMKSGRLEKASRIEL